MITRFRRTTLALTGALLLIGMAGGALAQEGQSAAPAKELAQLMDGKKMMVIAAKDPADADSFVAAMYFAGSQLLVVGAKYEPAVLLNEKLGRKEYQEIYIDLNSAAKAGTRIFIEDLGADGLKPQREEGKGFDSADIKGKRTTFDEQWRKDQKLTEEQWTALFGETDKTYAKLLQVLLREAKK
jgi:hypothetical protein